MDERYLRKMRFLNHTPGLRQERVDDLLRRIKADLPLLKKWLLDAREEEEDGFYRFYHGSFKVCERLQPLTREGFRLIVDIGGETDPPNEDYCQIYEEGTRCEFDGSCGMRYPTST